MTKNLGRATAPCSGDIAQLALAAESARVAGSSGPQTARGQAEQALAFDRSAATLLERAQMQLTSATIDLAAFVDLGQAPDARGVLARAVEEATRAHALAAEEQARSRGVLARALDVLGAVGDGPRLLPQGDVVGYSSKSAAAAVVAEAAAIAATAEADLAAEVQARTLEAAQIAEDAVAAAAVTVARAAETARQARQAADRLAAEDIAATAAITATGLQVRADALAAATSAAAAAALANSPRPEGADAITAAAQLAAQVAATARSGADETAVAAQIVARAVAADAAAAAIATSAAAAATEQEVRDAAATVRAVAEATAREMAAASPGSIADQAAITASVAAIEAATTTAGAARNALAARALATALAAAAVALAAARAADAVQGRADELAVSVANAAWEAAAAAAKSIQPGNRTDAAARAAWLRTYVIAAAAAKAEETTRAAALVTRSVAAAAQAAAAKAAAQAAAMEVEVREAALAVEAITEAAAVRLASATLEGDASIALATRAATAAAEQLWAANLQLERSGRHDREVALALQRAMLARLPESDEVAMAARYITAAERDQVGGDWYDVVVMPTGSITLTVGAVVGHDIAAATMMGQLRNVLRTLVWERRESPSAVVQRLDSAMRDLGLDTMATAVLMNVDEPMAGEPDSVATLRWTSAGHPAPILIRGDGTAAILDDATDIMLGVRPDAVRREHTRPVPPGATLLLYTDGLIESRSQAAEDGQRRLLDAVRTHHDLEPNDLLDALIADLADDRPSDDIVVLAVRFGDEPLPTRPR